MPVGPGPLPLILDRLPTDPTPNPGRTMQEQPKPPPSKNTLKWLAVGLAVVVVWILFASSARRILQVDEMMPPDLTLFDVPRPAEFRWNLFDVDGKPVEFASFKGRTIVLNLWATWCPPCLKEMPSIASLMASPDLKGRDVAFVCVSTDESAEALRSFMKDKDWKMTILRATTVPAAFQSEGIPATFLIAPDGRIAAAEMGAARWDDTSVVYFLQKLARKGNSRQQAAQEFVSHGAKRPVPAGDRSRAVGRRGRRRSGACRPANGRECRRSRRAGRRRWG